VTPQDLTFLPQLFIAMQQTTYRLNEERPHWCARSFATTGECAMTTLQSSPTPTVPVLHVFEQAGGWHWGITIPRGLGSGFKVIAFSESTFPLEDAARTDGSQVLASLEGAAVHS
jgi:hypothetical protein